MAGVEKKYENKIKKYFREKGLYYFKFWGTMCTRSGVPDLIVCVNGHFVGVEVKSDVGEAFDLQKENIRQIRENGGFAIVIHPDQYQTLIDLIECLLEGYDKNARLIEQSLPL